MKLKEFKDVFSIKGLILVLLGSIFSAVAINMFYSPSGLYTLGVTGISMILNTLTKEAGYEIVISIWLILLNIPLLILAYLKLGKRFTLYTVLSVILVSIFVEIVSVPTVPISEDLLLNGIFGGLFMGTGISLTLKAGGSTGGTDVLSLYYSFKKNMSIGQLALAMNGTIALAAGLLSGIEIGLYTIIASFITSSVIDKLHTRYQKLRVEIITDKADILATGILERVHRGMTRVKVTGGYSKVNKEMLVIIITSYELVNIKEVVKEIDPNAFISISDCKGIIGNFFNNGLNS